MVFISRWSYIQVVFRAGLTYNLSRLTAMLLEKLSNTQVQYSLGFPWISVSDCFVSYILIATEKLQLVSPDLFSVTDTDVISACNVPTVREQRCCINSAVLEPRWWLLAGKWSSYFVLCLSLYFVSNLTHFGSVSLDCTGMNVWAMWSQPSSSFYVWRCVLLWVYNCFTFHVTKGRWPS